MSLISVNNFSFSYPGSPNEVFTNISFNIESDWKIGIIGRNGIGKTTLLNIFMNSNDLVGNVSFEYFPYKFSIGSCNVEELILNELGPYLKIEKEMDFCADGEDDCTQERYVELLEIYMDIDGYNIRQRIERELGMLGLSSDIMHRKYETLSNGEQTKVAIALLFLKNDKYILLDEPTNHLDYSSRLVLADYLNKKKNFILVSHDREIINRCVDHIMYIGNEGIRIEKGNYDSWKYNQDGREKFYDSEMSSTNAEKERLAKSISCMKEWAEKAGENSQDKFSRRIGNMEKRQSSIVNKQRNLVDERERKDRIFANCEPYRQTLLISMNKVNVSVDDRTLLHGFDCEINQGDRVALVGPNGCGKSTLLKMVMNLIPRSGISYNRDLKISYIPQDSSKLTGTLDAVALQHSIDGTLLRTLLYQLGIERKDINRDIDEMSEGQKKKVLVAASLAEKAHVYVWDEPMNYLDISCRELIEDMILRQNLTVIFVEHDVAFVNRIATRRVDFADYQK